MRNKQIDDAINTGALSHQAAWSESIAMGDTKFVEQVQEELGMRLASGQTNCD